MFNQQNTVNDDFPKLVRQVYDTVDYVWGTASEMLMLVVLPFVAVGSFYIVFIRPFISVNGYSPEGGVWYSYPIMGCVMIGAARWWCALVKGVIDARKSNRK